MCLQNWSHHCEYNDNYSDYLQFIEATTILVYLYL